nr:hypothetical protein [uncultured organism]
MDSLFNGLLELFVFCLDLAGSNIAMYSFLSILISDTYLLLLLIHTISDRS